MGAYTWWALIRGWALINFFFTIFSKFSMFILHYKTNKEEATKKQQSKVSVKYSEEISFVGEVSY